MKVRMLKMTNFKGIREVGSEHEIAEAIGTRWVAKGIAEAVEVATTPATAAEEPSQVGDEPVAYASLTAKQLYQECLDRDMEVEPKQNKQYYVDLLMASDLAKDSETEVADPIEE